MQEFNYVFSTNLGWEMTWMAQAKYTPFPKGAVDEKGVNPVIEFFKASRQRCGLPRLYGKCTTYGGPEGAQEHYLNITNGYFSDNPYTYSSDPDFLRDRIHRFIYHHVSREKTRQSAYDVEKEFALQVLELVMADKKHGMRGYEFKFTEKYGMEANALMQHIWASLTEKRIDMDAFELVHTKLGAVDTLDFLVSLFSNYRRPKIIELILKLETDLADEQGLSVPEKLKAGRLCHEFYCIVAASLHLSAQVDANHKRQQNELYYEPPLGGAALRYAKNAVDIMEELGDWLVKKGEIEKARNIYEEARSKRILIHGDCEYGLRYGTPRIITELKLSDAAGAEKITEKLNALG